MGEKSRIGVVGKNGVGKSTFLQLLLGELESTSGEIKRQRGLKLAYIGQHDVENMRSTTQSPMEYFAQAFPNAKEHEVLEKLNEFGVLAEINEPISSLSGGQCMRVLLAKISAEEPHFMILDEPTNHLDIYTIDSLIAALNSFQGGVIFATHNRHFLDEAADDILDLARGSFSMEKAELEPDVIHISGLRRSNWRGG